jgi:endonuclease/exonuclease/phosphatase family metal-dependent hydrolase
LALLVRTWNLFHGNAQPPERHAYLNEMVRLAAADRPDALCLQEVPAWALSHLSEWTGMQAFGDVAQPPRFGPLPIPAELGRALTSPNHGLFRSAFAGQGNAILLAAEAGALAHDHLVLNSREFREREAQRLQLGLIARLAWAKERRIVQAVRARWPDGTAVLVANLHATAYDADQRIADAELLRAATFADGVAEPGDVVVLAGDFNIPPERSATQAELSDGDWGFAAVDVPGIDRILVRGAPVDGAVRWPRERRRLDGRIVSDHAPVEARVG